MPVSWIDARVITAGVGLPFGFVGGSLIHCGAPSMTSSASPAGVYSVISGLLPAADIPCIFAVSVVDSTQRKRGFAGE
ncbi:hypothetical protein DRN85_06510, partial [Methanosarcinales archaeon]